MAQEIVVHVTCDVCGDTLGPEVQPVILSLGSGIAPRRLDLCDTHLAALVDPLGALFDTHGQPLDEAAPTSTPARPRAMGKGKPRGRSAGLPPFYPCLLCDREFGSASGVRQHYLSAHGVGATGRILGQTCPVCDLPTGSYVALERHANEVHAQPTADLLLQRAAQSGDPHGVVKTAREALSAMATAR